MDAFLHFLHCSVDANVKQIFGQSFNYLYALGLDTHIDFQIYLLSYILIYLSSRRKVSLKLWLDNKHCHWNETVWVSFFCTAYLSVSAKCIYIEMCLRSLLHTDIQEILKVEYWKRLSSPSEDCLTKFEQFSSVWIQAREYSGWGKETIKLLNPLLCVIYYW